MVTAAIAVIAQPADIKNVPVAKLVAAKTSMTSATPKNPMPLNLLRLPTSIIFNLAVECRDSSLKSDVVNGALSASRCQAVVEMLALGLSLPTHTSETQKET